MRPNARHKHGCDKIFLLLHDLECKCSRCFLYVTKKSYPSVVTRPGMGKFDALFTWYKKNVISLNAWPGIPKPEALFSCYKKNKCHLSVVTRPGIEKFEPLFIVYKQNKCFTAASKRTDVPAYLINKLLSLCFNNILFNNKQEKLNR